MQSLVLWLLVGLGTADEHRLPFDRLRAALDQRQLLIPAGRVVQSGSEERIETSTFHVIFCFQVTVGLDMDWEKRPVLLDQRITSEISF